MLTQKTFFPDQALIFHSLPEEFQLIHEMGRLLHDLCTKGYPEREALYFAYVQTHRNPHGIATANGAFEFYRRMTEYLRTAMEMVEGAIERYFRPFAERLPSHNSVANCLDPIQMLKMATADPVAHASSLERRRHFEAQRQLGIALQLFAIESVDEESTVAEDLSAIDRLTWERLFTPGVSVDLWMLAELDPENGNRHKHLELFRAHKLAKRASKPRRAKGTLFREELLPCRVASAGDLRYLVYAVNRRKRLLSTLLKLERGRPTGDRRGWKYVVVGVQNGSSTISLAERDDAEAFHAHTRTVLWQKPLLPGEDPKHTNPNRHPTYWDRKIVGRFLRPDNGRIVAGAAEQLTTTIADHFDTLFATDDLNHTLYRARQAYETLGPLWFPHERELYKNIVGMRLPGFGVDWNSPHFKDQLERWWKSQL